MRSSNRSTRLLPYTIGAALLAAPALHPLLIPLIGVPSHLLWWVHVLPVAWITFTYGQRAAVLIVPASGLLVASGEAVFGAGYWTPADWNTVLSLTVAVTGTNLLVAGFALYARRVGRTYRLLFSRAAIGILNTDGSGRIRGINPVAASMLGAQPEVTGRPLADVLGLPGGVSVDEIARSHGWSGTIRPATAGRAYQVAIAAVDQEEQPGHQVLVLDRTLEAAQEQQLARSSQLASLGEALAGVAHELKNPLAVISGYADLGADRPDPVEAAAYFEEIARSAKRMKELITDLLGMARPSVASTTSIQDLLRRVIVLQRIMVGDRIRLEEDLLFAGEVAGSADRLEQIITNLLSNAADAIGDSSGVISLRSERVGDAVAITVQDSGSGIPAGVLPQLFEPFVTSKADGAGTGLGLAISRRLALGMGGDLTGRNRPEGGAEFTLTVPMLSPATSAEPLPLARAQDSS